MKFTRCKVLIPHNLPEGTFVRLTRDQWERRRHALDFPKVDGERKFPVICKVVQPIIFKVGEEVHIEEVTMKAKAIRNFYEDMDAPPPKEASPNNPAAAPAGTSQAQDSQNGLQDSSENAGESANDEGAQDQGEQSEFDPEAYAAAAAVYTGWKWKKLKAEVESRGGVWNDEAEAIDFLAKDDLERAAEEQAGKQEQQ